MRGMFSIFSSLRKLSIIEERNIIRNFSSGVRGRYHPNSTVTHFSRLPRSRVRVVHTNFEPLLANLSDGWVYLNEFEWSVRRVKVENIAVRLLVLQISDVNKVFRFLSLG